jgi:hypothetical protein
MPCLCGSARCRGVVRSFQDLSVELQRHYLAEGIVQQFLLDEMGLSPQAVAESCDQAPSNMSITRSY